MESSSLVSAGYAKSTQILEIEFKTGAIYRYFDVPATVYEEFLKAESKGRYFTQAVRGKYAFQRVDAASP